MANPMAVKIQSDGLTLIGDLRIPERTSTAPMRAVVVTGPITAVKEQVAGTYASALADAGLVTLALDHRNYGESEGEPRQHEDAAGKLADLRDAVSFLAGLSEVDAERIGVCGICFGTSYAVRFAAFDPRVRALALIGGAYNSPDNMRAAMGAEGYRALLADLAAVAQRQYATGAVEYMDAVADAGAPAAMPGQEPFDYYGTDRAASPGWKNRLTRLSLKDVVTFDAVSPARLLSPTPTLVVHGEQDAYLPPAAAQAFYDMVGEPKELMWLPTELHIDLYDRPEFVGPAAAKAAEWFERYL